MNENWTDIPGYGGVYQAGESGAIRSLHHRYNTVRVLKPRPSGRGGYPCVTLYDQAGGRRQIVVHKLVLLAFLGPRPEGMEVRHLDGDPTNSALRNLVYGTHAENMQDVTPHGRGKAAWTHCTRGHEFTPENTQRSPRGHRKCRTCTRKTSREGARRRNAAKRAALLANAEKAAA